MHDMRPNDLITPLASKTPQASVESVMSVDFSCAVAETVSPETFAQAVLNALSAQLCVVDEHGQVISTNDAWKTFGHTNALHPEPIAQGANYLALSDEAAITSPDAAAFSEGLRTVLRGELVEYCQEYPSRTTETIRWFVARITRFFLEEKMYAVITQEDITERKLAESELARTNKTLEQHVQERTAQLRDALHLFQTENTKRKHTQKDLETLGKAIEQASDVVMITDRNGKIEYVNSAFETISGYSRHEVIGQNPRILKSGKHDAAFYADMWQKLTHGEIWRGNMINRRKDGGLWEVDTTIYPLRDLVGNIVNYVSIKHDMSRIMHLESQLRQSQKMEAVGSLAGGIAHDFNNILSAIVGYTELSRTQLPHHPEVDRYLTEVLNASHRAAELIQQILMFSRQTEQERRPISIVPTIRESLKLLRGSLPPNIEFHCEIDPECPMILADPTQIHQIMMNLSTNAYHAMEKEGGLLTVTLKSLEITPEMANDFLGLHPGRHVSLSIADTGSGMDEKTRSRIFDPYFTTKPEGKGTGLGLSIVHGIVNAHQGAIQLTSEIGVGTCFTILFPATETSEENIKMHKDELKSGHGEHIMLVDDESWVLETNTRLLKRIGYEVAPFQSPLEALEYCQHAPTEFDLAIIDNAMPKLDGITLARQLATFCSGLKIILMTGMAPVSLAEEARAAGIQRVVMKPVSLALLSEAIQETMQEMSLNNP